MTETDPIRLLVVDGGPEAPAPGAVLDQWRAHLRSDGLVAVVSRADWPSSLRVACQTLLPDEHLRASLTVPVEPVSMSSSPVLVTTATVTVYAVEAGYEPPAPGKWDVILVPGWQSKKGAPVDEDGESDEVIEGLWTRARVLRASRFFSTWLAEHAAEESFDSWFRRHRDQRGERPDAVRLRNDEIEMYYPPELAEDTTVDLWTELSTEGSSPDAALGTEVVERLLDWFTDPGDVIACPLGSSAPVTEVATRTHRVVVSAPVTTGRVEDTEGAA